MSPWKELQSAAKNFMLWWVDLIAYAVEETRFFKHSYLMSFGNFEYKIYAGLELLNLNFVFMLVILLSDMSSQFDVL